MICMEKKLAKLFDYQKFEQNEKLSTLIKETEERCARELNDEDLEMVNAAGIPERIAVIIAKAEAFAEAEATIAGGESQRRKV